MYDLQALLDTAHRLARQKCPSTEETAGVALALAACRDAIDAAMEPLKKGLRSAAKLEKPSDDPEAVVVFRGHLNGEGSRLGLPLGEPQGSVTVTFQGTRPHMPKGFSEADAGRLEALLGVEFGIYFDRKVTITPRRDFKEQCLARRGEHPTEVAAAVAAVDMTFPTPRVGFRPLRETGPRGKK